MNPQRIGSLNKSARLIILQQMMDNGTLPPSKPELADLLGVTRITIYRDLADLKKLQGTLQKLQNKVQNVGSK